MSETTPINGYRHQASIPEPVGPSRVYRKGEAPPLPYEAAEHDRDRLPGPATNMRRRKAEQNKVREAPPVAPKPTEQAARSHPSHGREAVVDDLEVGPVPPIVRNRRAADEARRMIDGFRPAPARPLPAALESVAAAEPEVGRQCETIAVLLLHGGDPTNIECFDDPAEAAESVGHRPLDIAAAAAAGREFPVGSGWFWQYVDLDDDAEASGFKPPAAADGPGSDGKASAA